MDTVHLVSGAPVSPCIPFLTKGKVISGANILKGKISGANIFLHQKSGL